MTEITKLGFTQKTMYAFFEKKMGLLEKYKGKFIAAVTEQLNINLRKTKGVNAAMRTEAVNMMRK